jgi:hypothetical protein
MIGAWLFSKKAAAPFSNLQLIVCIPFFLLKILPPGFQFRGLAAACRLLAPLKVVFTLSGFG